MLLRFCLYGFLKNQRYFEPFFMLFFLEQGFSFLTIGVLIAARELTVNLLEIPSGAIADSVGRRGSMVVSLLAYIFSFLTFAIATHVGWFFVAMILYGVGDSFRTGTHKAMIFEWLRLRGEQDRRVQIYGFTRSWSQLGSALSGILAAGFILFAGNYRVIFLAAVIPYLANLVNLATYPAELNGSHKRSYRVSHSLTQLKQTLLKTFRTRPLRRLMFETMGWEGFFHAAKDYLQPALLAFSVLTIAWLWPEARLSEPQQAALMVGPVYAMLFLLSAWASRKSHRLARSLGGTSAAVRQLWLANTLALTALAIASWFGWIWLIVGNFILLHVLYNVWRPILIGRFDEHSEAHEGATVLSLESQAQRFFTMIIAPVLGFAVDLAIGWTPETPIWPVGVIGAAISLVYWLWSEPVTRAS